jgi:hypothetical protein
MPRPSLTDMPIAKLESILASRRLRKGELMKHRAKVLKELDKIEKQIQLIDGKAGEMMSVAASNGGTRVRNEKNLVSFLEDVLSKHPKGLPVGDIANEVLSAGYKTSSGNFRGIVNQTLIKEAKKFTSVERGVYALK